MSEIKNGRLDLYGIVQQCEELGFEGLTTIELRITTTNKSILSSQLKLQLFRFVMDCCSVI